MGIMLRISLRNKGWVRAEVGGGGGVVDQDLWGILDLWQTERRGLGISALQIRWRDGGSKDERCKAIILSIH